MIVVVEGVSAAGKSTWCNTHHSNKTVWELPPAHGEEEALDEAGRQEFWASRNSQRWDLALELEVATGLAVCDTDPFKLHYPWSLWRLGNLNDQQWKLAVLVTRRRFVTGVLGLADLTLVSEVSQEELARRHQVDAALTGRRRGKFDLHAQLADSLRAWYEAVERLERGRVRWILPPDGDLSLPTPRQVRSGAELFDALLAELPAR